MPSRLECKKKHRYYETIYDFLTEAAHGTEIKCKKCNGSVNYVSTQYYPGIKKTRKLELDWVKEKKINSTYHVFLLKLKRKHTVTYWLQYWILNKGVWQYGQNAPLLTKKQMKDFTEWTDNK
jgi:hypothetical protein